MPTNNHPLIRAQAERAAQRKAAAQERRSLAARNIRFGSYWTEAQPETQHSGTIFMKEMTGITSTTTEAIWSNFETAYDTQQLSLFGMSATNTACTRLETGFAPSESLSNPAVSSG